MNPIRQSVRRLGSTKQYPLSTARLQAARTGPQRRSYATSPSELADSKGTPMWIYGAIAAGAGSMLYLWRKGNAKAKAEAGVTQLEHQRDGGAAR
ncbi:hypothetical protein N7539_004402 [Penicillium diatomitis]|uniref:Uncharacterized protein n=1 Tax=Penicillium diatomitis TaxID=2819901 RepID=A0A9W9XDY5_9EURO|nr:uncharacterized protein N7539_004402 [Penicillium diatomitis]KAJ5489512.1 hypothetical protein N7539_004402 [Penicillium diatomitis]